MAKQAPEEQLDIVGAFLYHLGECMTSLAIAVRDESEEDIKGIMESLPTKREITKNLVMLGKLLEGQPWKKVKRNAG